MTAPVDIAALVADLRVSLAAYDSARAAADAMLGRPGVRELNRAANEAHAPYQSMLFRNAPALLDEIERLREEVGRLSAYGPHIDGAALLARAEASDALLLDATHAGIQAGLRAANQQAPAIPDARVIIERVKRERSGR